MTNNIHVNQKKEQNALKLSIYGALGMGLLGLIFALLTESDAILLDGFFSLIGFIMSLLTVKVSALVFKPDNKKFNFGYAKFEPFLNAAKGLIILGVTGFALFSSITVILDGGRELSLGWAIIYSFIATFGCFIITFKQKSAAKSTGSLLLEVDSKNWFIDGAISSGVAGAFIIAFFIQDTRLDYIIPYVDSSLVILISIFALPIPINILRNGLRELLFAAPDEVTQNNIIERIKKITTSKVKGENIIRMAHIGRFLYLNIYVIVPKEETTLNVKIEDDIRKKLYAGLSEFHNNLQIDVSFTHDRSLAADG